MTHYDIFLEIVYFVIKQYDIMRYVHIRWKMIEFPLNSIIIYHAIARSGKNSASVLFPVIIIRKNC